VQRLRIAARFVLAVGVLAALALLPGTAASAARPDPRAHRIASSMRQLFGANRLSAMVYGVWVNGRPFVTGVLGHAMQGVPATQNMHFRVGNVTESMTTTLLLRFVDQGKVSLDAPVSRWFPGLPRARQVTLRMLATSTSGYADYVTAKAFQKQLDANPFQRFTPLPLIRLGTGLPPVFAPGKSWAFSDTNFLLLGAILQKIARKPLPVALRQQIFGPVGLRQTVMPTNASIPSPVMHSYTTERGPYEDATYWTPSWASLNGSVTSTLSDMGRWAAALGDGTRISRASRSLQLGRENIGLGPNTDKHYYGMGAVLTNGWVLTDPQVDGYTGTVSYFPAKKIAVVAFATLGPKSLITRLYGIVALHRIAGILTPRSLPDFSSGGRVS
jgi:D-alanyl-D-alanine carboxypeptidase